MGKNPDDQCTGRRHDNRLRVCKRRRRKSWKRFEHLQSGKTSERRSRSKEKYRSQVEGSGQERGQQYLPGRGVEKTRSPF